MHTLLANLYTNNNSWFLSIQLRSRYHQGINSAMTHIPCLQRSSEENIYAKLQIYDIL
jgi:hypothetical protein